MVLAPTRELALQVTKEFNALKHYEGVYNVLTVYGGVSIEDQTYQLRRGVDIFVGTTGRILDHMERRNFDFSHLKTVVLDEADQMLKLGFKEDVEAIMNAIKEKAPKDIQVLLFSATVPSWVKAMAEQFLSP
jgi:ATP-dependent RNA helicase DeaD